MKVLIKNGRVVDPVNKINDKYDVLIENNFIKKIERSIVEIADYNIDAKGMIVSPGFVDLHPNFCDPGVTSREDLKSGSLSAAKGGYTHVVLGTDNKPAPSECNVIEYIRRYAKIMPINIYPSASATIGKMGEEVVDVNFLCNHGAVAFYDGLRPIDDKEVLEKVMKAISKVDGVLSIYSEVGYKKKPIKVRGILDGQIAQNLGIKGGTPIDAEYNDLEENIALAKYLNCTLDLAYVTSEKSIAIVEKAKNEGQKIYAEVPALNLILTDKSVEKFKSLAKVLPPLRSDIERKALCKALKRGIIDIISSNHVPVLEEDKNQKLKNAISGCIGLETVLGICGAKLINENILNWSEVIEKISTNPAKIFNLDKNGAGKIDEGTIANITIFAPNEKWKLSNEEIVSKSHNTPVVGMELLGRVKYTICNGKLIYRDINNDNF